MGGHRRHRILMMLVAAVVIAASALCLLHAHADGLEFCAPAVAVAGLPVLGALLPGARFLPVLVTAFPIAVLDPTSPPPRS